MARLLRLIFQSFIKKHKPHKINEATMGSRASSGTYYIISELLLSLFSVDFCFLFDWLYFFHFTEIHCSQKS